MKIIAMLLGVAIALFATVSARAQAPPPPNAGLFQSVAGKWGWKDSPDYSCETNPHFITYSESNRRLTLTHAKPFIGVGGQSKTDSVYDVLYAESNKITVYLQGETRRTKSGDRVIWVLVLLDKDTYAWRRTDWEADEMTKHIVRCRGN